MKHTTKLLIYQVACIVAAYIIVILLYETEISYPLSMICLVVGLFFAINAVVIGATAIAWLENQS